MTENKKEDNTKQITITCYPEMDKKIVELLQMRDEDAISLYAAQRIKDLEKEINEMRFVCILKGKNIY